MQATADNDQYRNLVQHYIGNRYTLRYSGALVPDVFHILAKGSGVYTTVASPSAKCKLRLLCVRIVSFLISLLIDRTAKAASSPLHSGRNDQKIVFDCKVAVFDCSLCFELFPLCPRVSTLNNLRKFSISLRLHHTLSVCTGGFMPQSKQAGCQFSLFHFFHFFLLNLEP
jgi:hypothetical protein